MKIIRTIPVFLILTVLFAPWPIYFIIVPYSIGENILGISLIDSLVHLLIPFHRHQIISTYSAWFPHFLVTFFVLFGISILHFKENQKQISFLIHIWSLLVLTAMISHILNWFIWGIDVAHAYGREIESEIILTAGIFITPIIAILNLFIGKAIKSQYATKIYVLVMLSIFVNEYLSTVFQNWFQ